MLQPEETDWLNGYKSRTHIYAVYKNPISDLKTQIDWKWEDGKYIRVSGKQKKAGVAILISDKIDLKIKKITRQGRTLPNDQGIDITIVKFMHPA